MPEQGSKSDKWEAAVMSLFFLGMGQVYNREYRKAVGFFVSLLFVGIAAEFTGYLILKLATYAIVVYAAYDAYTTAKNSTTPPNKKAAWVAVILFILVILFAAWSESFNAAQG